MKNWEKLQMKIVIAPTAREFIVRVLGCNSKLETYCNCQRLQGKCDSKNPKKCEECIIDWLNSEEE